MDYLIPEKLIGVRALFSWFYWTSYNFQIKRLPSLKEFS